MLENKLSSTILHLLEDFKALDIQSLNISNISDFADTMIICTATSSRHCQAIYSKLMAELKSRGTEPYHRHSAADSRWILLDYCDVVVHIMLKDTRQFYELEKLWTEIDMPVAVEA
ncbi:MAG: ribosome silencing factor [Coxiellaceae bacterium]|nr:ribosome silencing factor [Coxiellaceae bacterium]